jgi:hypothetical protein
MQFQVPQFIEIEDKIIGPLTFTQFIYIAGGIGLAFTAWKTLPSIYISAPFIGIALAAGAGFAFGEYNSRPITDAMEHGFYYLTRGKMFRWSAEHTQKRSQESLAVARTPTAQVVVPMLSQNKVRELAWSLDINEKINREQAQQNNTSPTTLTDILRTVHTAQSARIQ